MRLVDQPFSLRHLPYGIVDFGESRPHLSVRLGDLAISLEVLRRGGLLQGLSRAETESGSLNALLALPAEVHRALRATLSGLLEREEHLETRGATLSLAAYPQDDERVRCPVDPGDYVDFYCSRHHAYRVGCLFRGPEHALPEQYFDLPIGYHGRSSTIGVSGQQVRRPRGIVSGPTFAPSARLDYELEMAYLLRPNATPMAPDQASELIFGVVLLNDWSARDIQAYEYKPLGPFLGKSFATTVGAWVTPWEALEEWQRPNTDSDHAVLPHLRESGRFHLDLPLWAHLDSPNGEAELCQTNLQHLAWSPAQMVSHLTSNGTTLRAGDLIGSGTVSGPESGSEACLLERTSGGKEPLPVANAERKFFLDGDTVTLLGGWPGVGLAPCRGRVASHLDG